MKPNFALSLFFDKVELLHRTETGWDSLGEVAFDAEDLPGALSALRKKALTHDPAGLRTKLILPDEQVKFLSLPDAKADDAAVREALDGATPYSLDELAYEAASDGRRTHIAAVARETLDEAEAFAVEHRFAPVSIVAQTVVGRFDGEPFFGMTKAASGLIGPDDTVERDNPPAALAEPAPEPAAKEAKPAPEPENTPETKAEAEPKPEAKAEPEPTPKPDAEAKPTADPKPDPAPKPDAEAKSEAPKTDAKTESAPPAAKPDEPVKPTAPDTADAAPEEPVFASRARSHPPADGDPIAAAVTALRSDTPSRITPQSEKSAPPKPAPKSSEKDSPATPAAPRTVPQPVPPRPAPGTPPPAVAERLARIARTDVTAERPGGPIPPAINKVPERPTEAATLTTKAPPVAPPVASKSAPKPKAPSPKSIAASLKPAEIPSAPSSGRFASRRKKGDPTEEQVAGAATAPDAAEATAKDRSKMTVFDQRAEGQVRGKPRFLLPILIALLLLFMAGAAAWATIFTEEGVSGWFRSTPQVEDPILTAAPSDTTPLTVPLAPAVETGPIVLPTGTDPVDPATVTPEQLAGIALPDDASLDPEVTANPEAPPPEEEEVVVEVDPIITPTTPPGTVLSPAEADRFYAATGVWLRAPRLVVTPTSQALGDLSTAATDRALTTRAATATLPAGQGFFPDAALGTQLDPPGPDVVFPRDERGLLLASAEGTATPYGMLIYAGLPAVVPPTRPGTIAPEPVVEPEVEAEEDTPQVAETDPDTTDEQDAVTATLEALIAESISEPEATPETETAEAAPEVIEPVEAPETPLDARGLVLATAEGTQTDGLIVFAGLPAVVPPTRPGTTLPTEETPAEDVAEAAPEDTPQEEITPGGVSFAGLRPNTRPETLDIPATAVALPAYDGLRPAVRPAGLAPEVVEEVAPAEPEIDDTTVAATLAAIVAAAPDPLAGATAQAVTRAIVPEARPRNFDRVVAAAQARQASTVPTTPTTTTRATEPETVTTGAAQPTGPIPQSVASAATIESVINLRQINLIGVYGRPNDRRALVRLANGRYVRVSVGDRLDGGQVTAIGDNVINYVKRGQTIALGVPG